MKKGEIKKFDVFITPRMEGNLMNKDKINEKGLFQLEIDHIKSIISQLFEGLAQLEQAKMCHNDLKPSNILYTTIYDSPRMTPDMMEWDVDIKIGDFGQCQKREGELLGGPLHNS